MKINNIRVTVTEYFFIFIVMNFCNFPVYIQILALFFKAFVKYVLSEYLSSNPLESKVTCVENGRFGL